MFDWKNHERKDLSWWDGIESFAYLITMHDSERSLDRQFTGRWFNNWYVTHENYSKPNEVAWDPVAAGMRVMVFVRYLKEEEQREPRDEELIEKLRKSICEHQRFLKEEENFDKFSNHGMWEAMGLFEACGVFLDPMMRDPALSRLRWLTKKSVSTEGIHNEQAVAYH